MDETGQTSLRDKGKAKRRQAVLEAARAIIREGNSTGFAMRALAQRAGVGEVTPYNLFGSKRGVLEAIIRDEVEDHRHRFEGAEARDELDAIFTFVTVSIDTWRRDPELYRTVFRDLMMSGDTSLRAVFSAPQSRLFLGLIEAAVRAGYLSDMVEPRLSARTLGRISTSSIADWLWEGISLESLEANIALGFAIILRGLATPMAAGRCDSLIAAYQADVIRHSRTAAARTAQVASEKP